MGILSILTELKEIVESGMKMPLTGKVLVDQDEMLDLIEQLQEAIPEEIRKAEEIKKERELILAQAHEKAERILMETKKYVTRLAHENEIVQQAKEEAAGLTKQAKSIAQEIQDGAKAYADEVLGSLEKDLLKVGKALQEALFSIQQGREELKK